MRTTLEQLASRRGVFYSEASFQHSLALLLVTNCHVELEAQMVLGESERIDIWLPEQMIGIELKYPTASFRWCNEYGEFCLKNTGEEEAACHNFWKDVQRLENWKHLGKINEGYAIFLTNQKRFWEPPSSKRVHDELRIHDGRCDVTGEINVRPLGPRKVKPKAVRLRGKYNISWHDFATHEGRNGLFRFISLQV